MLMYYLTARIRSPATVYVTKRGCTTRTNVCVLYCTYTLFLKFFYIREKVVSIVSEDYR